MVQINYGEMFRDTGDPMCWLMLKASERKPANGSKGSEEKPQVSD